MDKQKIITHKSCNRCGAEINKTYFSQGGLPYKTTTSGVLKFDYCPHCGAKNEVSYNIENEKQFVESLY